MACNVFTHIVRIYHIPIEECFTYYTSIFFSRQSLLQEGFTRATILLALTQFLHWTEFFEQFLLFLHSCLHDTFSEYYSIRIIHLSSFRLMFNASLFVFVCHYRSFKIIYRRQFTWFPCGLFYCCNIKINSWLISSIYPYSSGMCCY